MRMIRMLAAAVLLLAAVSGAAAQETMRLYVEKGAADGAQVQRLLFALGQNMEDTEWVLENSGRTLRELVLAGDAPDLAVCRTKTARPWAQEGLLLPLHAHIPDQCRIQRQVLDLCIYGEELLMAPLIASHRRMAVNRTAFEQAGLGDMLDRHVYPVWYPAQFYRILEEFMLRGRIAVDIWHAKADNSAAIEALTQAFCGVALLGEDGETCHAGDEAMIAGVQWICDAAEDGMIGWQKTREDALSRFLRGETAIFIDWTQELEKQLESAVRERGMDIVTVPYPSAIGEDVRSFELTVACAFACGDAARDARLVHACALLHAAAQDALGARGIWQDGALWPASLDGGDKGATLRGLLCGALNEAMEEGNAGDALLRVQAVMDTLGRTR